jgi:hypothetical protein
MMELYLEHLQHQPKEIDWRDSEATSEEVLEHNGFIHLRMRNYFTPRKMTFTL